MIKGKYYKYYDTTVYSLEDLRKDTRLEVIKSKDGVPFSKRFDDLMKNILSDSKDYKAIKKKKLFNHKLYKAVLRGTMKVIRKYLLQGDRVNVPYGIFSLQVVDLSKYTTPWKKGKIKIERAGQIYWLHVMFKSPFGRMLKFKRIKLYFNLKRSMYDLLDEKVKNENVRYEKIKPKKDDVHNTRNNPRKVRKPVPVKNVQRRGYPELVSRS